MGKTDKHNQTQISTKQKNRRQAVPAAHSQKGGKSVTQI